MQVVSIVLVGLISTVTVPTAAPVRGDDAESFRPAAVPSASDSRQDVVEDRSLGVRDPERRVFGNNYHINLLLGGSRYYEHQPAINGQGTVTGHLGAGHFWNGHETLQHVETNDTNFMADPVHTWGGESIEAKYDRHSTWTSMMIGGRITSDGEHAWQRGMAWNTDLRSAAFATHFVGEAWTLEFEMSATTVVHAGEDIFTAADVVNVSWGGEDPSGTGITSVVLDTLCLGNPLATLVSATGDDGGTVKGPASGYNGISVGWLRSLGGYKAMSINSSRSPQEFGYIDSDGQSVILAGPRAAVDITAPGDGLISAFYGGQTGGNNPSLPGSEDEGDAVDAYSDELAGTSFSAPIVAGGASLVASAARNLPELSENPQALQSMVIKALLLNGATPTVNWYNGQQHVTHGEETYISTTQSVDWAAGTGRMDLHRTFDLQVGGQMDVPGTNVGDHGPVAGRGWDFGHGVLGVDNVYRITNEIPAGTMVRATLTWMRNRSYVHFGPSPPAPPIEISDLAQADLDLSIWSFDDEGRRHTLIARSESLYNTVEHLVVPLPETGRYAIVVEYPRNTFDQTEDCDWGSEGVPQPYGLSWHAEPCPGDLDRSGTVDPVDLGLLLGVWGTDGSSLPGADANHDGAVNGTDLAFILGYWGACIW